MIAAFFAGWCAGYLSAVAVVIHFQRKHSDASS